MWLASNRIREISTLTLEVYFAPLHNTFLVLEEFLAREGRQLHILVLGGHLQGSATRTYLEVERVNLAVAVGHNPLAEECLHNEKIHLRRHLAENLL